MRPRRQQYRSRPRRPLGLRLETSDDAVAGEVLDLSVRGCGALFDPGGLPPLQPEDRVGLEFRTLLLLVPLRAQAIVRRVGRLGERALVGLEFAEPELVERQVPFVLAAEFNRRRTPRVAIDDTVVVRVATLQVEDTALLLDVSTGGVRLRMGSRLALRLHVGDLLELSFALPEHREGFWVLGVVRGLRLADDHVSCSVRFDEETTVHFEAQRQALQQIVSRRRQALLGARSPGGAA